jgi:hypothetical protein
MRAERADPRPVMFVGPTLATLPSRESVDARETPGRFALRLTTKPTPPTMVAPRASGLREKARERHMSKQDKVVGVSIDARTREKLGKASEAVAEVVTAIMIGSDDSFGVKRPRKS